MYYQNDPSWRLKPLNNSKMTIGEVGCLLTSLCNSHNKDINPVWLNNQLIKHKGYTEGNLIIWAVAEKILGCKIDHIYTGKIEYDINARFIVNFLNFGTGHFCNLISKKGDNYDIYDVWDGKEKTIPTPRRIVRLRYDYR